MPTFIGGLPRSRRATRPRHCNSHPSLTLSSHSTLPEAPKSSPFIRQLSDPSIKSAHNNLSFLKIINPATSYQCFSEKGAPLEAFNIQPDICVRAVFSFNTAWISISSTVYPAPLRGMMAIPDDFCRSSTSTRLLHHCQTVEKGKCQHRKNPS